MCDISGPSCLTTSPLNATQTWLRSRPPQFIDDLGYTDMPEEQRNRCFLVVNPSGNGRVTFEDFVAYVPRATSRTRRAQG